MFVWNRCSETLFEEKKKNVCENVRIVIRWDSSCRIFKKHNNEKSCHTERGSERAHLLSSIVVTAPVFQLDTSWLNAYADWNTARKRVGCNKEKKDQIHHTNNHNKVPFQTKTKKRTIRVRLVTRRTSSCRIHVYSTTHHNRRRRGHREGERVHLLADILVTAPVIHFDTSWLNTDAW